MRTGGIDYVASGNRVCLRQPARPGHADQKGSRRGDEFDVIISPDPGCDEHGAFSELIIYQHGFSPQLPDSSLVLFGWLTPNQDGPASAARIDSFLGLDRYHRAPVDGPVEQPDCRDDRSMHSFAHVERGFGTALPFA